MTATMAATGMPAQGQPAKSPYADTKAADAWMQKWMLAPQAVNSPLEVGRFADPTYFLLKPIGWDPNPGQTPKSVAVPTKFVTDFASIPRVFWSILRPDGNYAYAAVIHDWLYWDQSRTREESDLILKYVMQDFKIDTPTITTIYEGVRLGGGGAWSDNAALKKAGEKRVLKKTPDDPTIRWADWKKRPDVF